MNGTIKYGLDKRKLLASFVGFICVFMLMNNSVGFDLYWHATSYYYYDEHWNYTDSFLGIFLTPRYLLLSYIFEISSRLGFPVALIICILVFVPAYAFFKVGSYSHLSLLDFASAFLIFIIAFFYSGLSLSLLWALALLKTNEKKFYLGTFFHPVALFIFLMVAIYKGRRDIAVYTSSIAFFLGFIFFMNYVAFFTSSVMEPSMLRNEVLLNSLPTLSLEVIRTKSNEFGIMSVIIFSLFLFRTFFSSIIDKISVVKVSFLFSLSSFIIFSVLILILMSNKVTFISVVLTGDSNDVIYISWFDWFEKNYNEGFYYVFSLRY